MSCVAIIPARAGSRRIPGKNKKLFHGRPIIEYSIEAAQQAKIFDLVVVSTDDEEIAAIAKGAGANVVWRPPELALDEVGTQEVTRHALDECQPGGWGPACCIYPTAPMLTPADLFHGMEMLILRPCSYVLSVGATPLRDIGMFYWGEQRNFKEGKELINCHTGLYVIPEDRAIDINTPEDWTRAEQMYEALK